MFKYFRWVLVKVAVVMLTACGGGGSGSKTNTNTSSNTIPKALTQNVILEEDTSKTITLSGTDVDGDSLTYRIITAPSHGTYDGTSYTPDTNYVGNDSLTFIANDGEMDSEPATVSITVTEVNDTPKALTQNVILEEDTSKTITLSGTDVDGDSLTYRIITAPSYGTYDGTSYTPDTNYVGNDSFSFIANDGEMDSQPGSVSITVTPVNDAPIASAQSFNIDKNTTTIIALSGTDVDGDSLTYRIVTAPSHGTYDGTSYTPDTNYEGSDSFTFVANDGKVDSAIKTITLYIKEQRPFITIWEMGTDLSKGDTLYIRTDKNYNYNYTIDWGDGTIDTHLTDDVNHTYLTPGLYTVKISGDFPHFYSGYYPYDMYEYAYDNYNLSSIEQWGNIEWKSMARSFYKCRNVVLNASDTPDLSQVEDMSYMFSRTDAFNQDISDWNVSNVTNMEAMFNYANGFNQDIGNWDVSSVVNMGGMFAGAKVFNQDIGVWDVSSVKNMYGMFAMALAFDQYIGDWNVSSVVDMEGMFASARVFNQDIGDWDVSSVVNMSGMFANAESFNQYIGEWNVSSVVNMDSMFLSARTFNQEIGGWDVSSVTDMYHMFHAAEAFDQYIGDWDVSSVTRMSQMFREAYAFNQYIGDWDVSSVTRMRFMFMIAKNFNQYIGNWNVSSVRDMNGMFDGAISFNQDIGGWDVSSVTDMGTMFAGAKAFNQDIGDWDVSSVTDMHSMFRSATLFDQDMGDWDISKVTNVNFMFMSVTLSTENYDRLLNGWSTKNLQKNLAFYGGFSKYSVDGEEARQKIIDDFGWSITDGGLE